MANRDFKARFAGANYHNIDGTGWPDSVVMENGGRVLEGTYESREYFPCERTDGWHTEPPSDDRYVLCQGARGAMFIGSFMRGVEGNMRFYVPNYSNYSRYAVAWHELPEPYTEVDDA